MAHGGRGAPALTRARQILRDIVARGHIVGNHTVHHRVLPQLTPAQIAYEIDHNADLIERSHRRAAPPASARPTARTARTCGGTSSSLHNELWLWSIDPHDYLRRGRLGDGGAAGDPRASPTTPAGPCSSTTRTRGASTPFRRSSQWIERDEPRSRWPTTARRTRSWTRGDTSPERASGCR
ncbi:polysaccharide deacetylase family protein [Nostocoides sp.]